MKILQVYSTLNNNDNVFFYMSIKIDIIDKNNIQIKHIYRINQVNSYIKCKYENNKLYIKKNIHNDIHYDNQNDIHNKYVYMVIVFDNLEIGTKLVLFQNQKLAIHYYSKINKTFCDIIVKKTYFINKKYSNQINKMNYSIQHLIHKKLLHSIIHILL
jgi:hypothetical protein